MKHLLIAFVLCACRPTLEPIAGCRPFSEECSPSGLPRICSADQRWHNAGDLPRCIAGEVCVVQEGHAHCAPESILSPDSGTL